MAAIKRQAPKWWSQHKKIIWEERQTKILEARMKYEKKNPIKKDENDEKNKNQSWEQYQKKQNDIELARLIQNTKSASELMRLNKDRTEMILTFTLGSPWRVIDTDKSFSEVMQRIEQQASSCLFHLRTLTKSTVFKSDESKECAYKKRLHYHWALELQTSGDIHMHIVVSLYDDIAELARLIDLVHQIRNNYFDVTFLKRDKKHGEHILPLGRTHFSLSAHLKEDLLHHYRSRNIKVVEWLDKENSSRLNYFFPSLSPNIDIYSGRGTLVEFNDNATMAKKYDSIRKYIISMTRAKFKLRTVQASISDAQRTHNLKGKFEGDESRAAEDIAVFEFLKLKLHSSSQMLFPKTFYQKVRKQLTQFKPRYKSLAQVTVDWCKGKITIEGTEPNRVIYHRGEIIAIEPKKKKITINDYLNENENEYAIIKGGI